MSSEGSGDDSDDGIVGFSGNEKHCEIEYDFGGRYTGASRKRLRHGPGRLIIEDEGAEWSGEFHDDLLIGAGREKTSAYEYRGAFVDHVKQGPGVMTMLPCRMRLEGSWDEGALHGSVRCLFPDGRFEMQCQFDHGEFLSGSCSAGEYEEQGDFPGVNPVQPDPYEEQYVIIGKSSIPGAGEGLFAKKAVPAGLLVSYYNGEYIDHKTVDARSWRYNSNTISLDDSVCLDVPLSHALSRQYRATTGHKVNNSRENNCEYTRAFHPFYGQIKAVQTTQPVAAGEEFFCRYDYKDEPRPPAWWRE